MSWTDKTLDILRRSFGNEQNFTLDQVAKGPLQYFYPNNNNVASSIRYCLQKLRDDGCIQFENDRGLYSWV